MSKLENLMKSKKYDFFIVTDDFGRLEQYHGKNPTVYHKDNFFTDTFLTAISGKLKNELKIYTIPEDERLKFNLGINQLPILIFLVDGVIEDMFELSKIEEQVG